MQLETIHLVQFFLYERQSFDLGHMTAVFGQNGSGKSALIDAVQIALFGGNAKLVALNAKTDNKRGDRRSIRSYCLGQYGEAQDDRARTTARTYITLVWRNPSNPLQVVSTGVCIEAFHDDPEHHVRGAYVADGVELLLGDHLTRVEGEDRPRDWQSFHQDLRRRVEAVSGHPDEVSNPSSERYLRTVLTRLSNGKDAGSMDLFRRALRFGLRLRFDQGVDETIRREVMEERPTNVEGFRVLVEQFRRMRSQFEQAQERLDAARDLRKKYQQAEEVYKRAQSWVLIGLDIERDAALSALEDAKDSAEQADGALEQAQAQLLRCEQSKNRLEHEQHALRMRQSEHPGHGQHAALAATLERARLAVEKERRRERDILAQLRATLFMAAQRHEVGAQAETLSKLAQRLDRHAELDTEALHAVVLEAGRGVAAAVEVLQRPVETARRRVEDLEGEIARTEEDLRKARGGLARLPDHVQRLRAYLEDHGVNTRPVCEGVSVRDKNWRQAVEALLGRAALTALIVDEHNEQRAYELYLKAPEGSGGRLVYTSWIDARASCSPGTVASLLEGTDPVALGFLRLARRGVECAESYEAVRRSRNALTPQGMYAFSGGIERLRLPREDQLLLGAAQADAAQALAQRLITLRRELSRCQEDLAPLTAVLGTLLQVPASERLWADVVSYRNSAQSAEAEADATQSTLQGSAQGDYYQIVAEFERCSKLLKEATDAWTEADRAVVAQRGVCKSARQEVERLEAESAVAHEKSQAASAESVFDQDYFMARWDALLTEHKSDYAKMREVCQKRITTLQTDAGRADRAATEAAQLFASTFGDHNAQAREGGWSTALPWIGQIVRALEEFELPEHREALEQAERAAEDAFRTDVAAVLHENVMRLIVHQDKLNEALRRCPPFSNSERYQFRRTLRPQYKLLFDFVDAVAREGSRKNLFGDPGALPAEFRALLEEKASIGNGNTRTPLDDYREFFEFDIEIMREGADGGAARKVGSLSKRIGPGSGGEHMAPLYVIAGAALASAYRLDSAGEPGMRLILIDEAFDKMDGGNISATMQFFEQIGLQILLACPIEKRPALTAFLDRYYTIVRNVDDNTVHVEPTDVPESARLLARADVLEHHPELLAAEIERVRSERLVVGAQ